MVLIDGYGLYLILYTIERPLKSFPTCGAILRFLEALVLCHCGIKIPDAAPQNSLIDYRLKNEIPIDTSCKAIDKVTSIHSSVETYRGSSIPDWAYRDVLFMLIYYSIASFELLERKLTQRKRGSI